MYPSHDLKSSELLVLTYISSFIVKKDFIVEHCGLFHRYLYGFYKQSFCCHQSWSNRLAHRYFEVWFYYLLVFVAIIDYILLYSIEISHFYISVHITNEYFQFLCKCVKRIQRYRNLQLPVDWQIGRMCCLQFSSQSCGRIGLRICFSHTIT